MSLVQPLVRDLCDDLLRDITEQEGVALDVWSFPVLDSDGNCFACLSIVKDKDGALHYVEEEVLDSDGNAFTSSGFLVLDSDGNTFLAPNDILDSDGNSFEVERFVKDKDGVEHAMGCT